jgi:diguanylate cyclase (GGDEF)-like protein/PAS domain S-box-containing protein
MPHEVWGRRHRILTMVLYAHVVALTALAVIHGYALEHAWVDAAPVAILAAAASLPALGRRLRTAATAVGLLTASAVLIHLTDGLTESHFHFFVMLALITLYQEWMPFLLAFGFVVVHHATMGLFMPDMVFSTPEAERRPLLWALIHGGYVLAAATANVYAWRLAEDERGRAEEALATGEGVYGVDSRGIVTFANPALLRLLGYEHAVDLIGVHHHVSVGHADADGTPYPETDCPACATVAAAAGTPESGSRAVRRDGTSFPFEHVAAPLDGGGHADGAVVSLRDVTERQALESQLTRQARYDDLTGLPNRTMFIGLLDEALDALPRTGDRFGVVLLDLDGFKSVNDTLGHQAGNSLLQGVADRLQEATRPGDRVSRLSGDEFAVLLGGLDTHEAAMAAGQRLVESLKSPFRIAERDIHISSSGGVAVASTGTGTSDGLLRDADLAMYAAKAAGKARCVLFSDGMRLEAVQRMETEQALGKAVDNGELRLHYQPVVELTSGRCVGVEALIRWAHPTRGLLSPCEFVPLAEDTGLIVPLGRWVVAEACRQAAEWRPVRSPGFTVSVNVSARQLADAGLVDHLERCLAEHDLEAADLTVEVTESVFLDEHGRQLDRLAELRALGVRVVLDDFGTGYSSLGYLHRFPVDGLKIDRSFVADLTDAAGHGRVTRAIVSLAQSFDLTVVAEGVEVPAQADALRAIGCELAQGYLFQRPEPATTVTALLAAGGSLLPAG